MTYDTINDAQTVAGNGEGTILAGRYRIVRQLGAGGMGSVWLAEDTQLDNKQFAIKMLPAILVANKRAYRQLKDEALVAMKLTHPNIVTLRAFEENNGNPFLVMDYIDGQTLDDYLADKGKLSEADVLRILRPIAAALDYAHGKGVVHRDVKPGNVMIAKGGTPYILDFGVAREIQETMTRVTGKLSSGTLLYMSPEQLNGERPTPSQDIYSFAAMAYECLNGEPPFCRGQIEHQILNVRPKPLSVDAAIVFSNGIMAGLSKDSSHRPTTCLGMLTYSRALTQMHLGPHGTSGSDMLLVKRSVGNSVGANGNRVEANGNRVEANGNRIGATLTIIAAIMVVFATCVVYFQSPKIYEAKSEFSINMYRSQDNESLVQTDGPDNESTYEEIFNTRLSDWRSDKIVHKIIQQYRANYPASTVTDAELIETLGGSELELVRHSRLVTIAVRSRTPALAAALANAYAEAIESFTDDENKLRCDKAVAQIHDSVEKQRWADEKVSKQLLDFRTANKIDNMKSEREILQQSLQKTAKDIRALQSEITAATEWEKVLESVRKAPENFGALPTTMPYSSEIRESYTRLQTAKMELTTLLVKFTNVHPEVRAKEEEIETLKQQFVDAVPRAIATVHGNLASYKNQLAVFQGRNDKLRGDLAAIEQKIVTSEAGLKLIEQEKQRSSTLYADLLQKENEARIAAMSNNEIVLLGRPAIAPSNPVLPNPKIIFGSGAVALVVIGLLFVCPIHVSQARGRMNND